MSVFIYSTTLGLFIYLAEDDGGQDGENDVDEGGTTAWWHEGCCENRRGTAKRDRKWKRADAQGARVGETAGRTTPAAAPDTFLPPAPLKSL